MQTYGQDVVDFAARLAAPPILVGHSMGGLVISQAAENRPDLFPALIYLAAFVPPPGQASGRDLPPISDKMMAAFANGLQLNPDGTCTFPGDAARDVFYNRCSVEIQDYAVARLSPQPAAAGASAVDTTPQGLGSVRKHYIECLRDQALPLESQRAMQKNAEFRSIHALDSDHSPFLSMPAELASLIAEIAEE